MWHTFNIVNNQHDYHTTPYHTILTNGHQRLWTCCCVQTRHLLCWGRRAENNNNNNSSPLMQVFLGQWKCPRLLLRCRRDIRIMIKWLVPQYHWRWVWEEEDEEEEREEQEEQEQEVLRKKKKTWTWRSHKKVNIRMNSTIHMKVRIVLRVLYLLPIILTQDMKTDEPDEWWKTPRICSEPIIWGACMRSNRSVPLVQCLSRKHRPLWFMGRVNSPPPPFRTAARALWCTQYYSVIEGWHQVVASWPVSF